MLLFLRLVLRRRETMRGKGTVDCGAYHSLVVSGEGSVWSFGCGHYGRLGHGRELEEVVPRSIANLEQVVAVAAGWGYSVALSAGGRVFTWGCGGRLGHNDANDRRRPTRVEGLVGVSGIASGGGHGLVHRSTHLRVRRHRRVRGEARGCGALRPAVRSPLFCKREVKKPPSMSARAPVFESMDRTAPAC